MAVTKMKYRYLTLAVVLLAASLPADGQKIAKIHHQVDSILAARYWKADIDTNYITRPKTKFTIMGRFNEYGARITAVGDEKEEFETKLQADYKSTVSVGVSYMGISLNLAINPAKMLGKYHDYELGFRSYGRRFGFDIDYQDATNFKGWCEYGDERFDIDISDGSLKVRTLNVNAYYVFSPRRFSYPAAFSHSYIQRRSAGSFLLAASGQGQHGKLTDEEFPIDFKMTNIALGGGYGYNFVPGKNWLLHISALPTIIVYSNTSITTKGTKFPLNYDFPEIIITTRGAVVKQIGSNMFGGFSVVFNYSKIGNDDNLSFCNQKWLGRLFFGVRL